MPLCGIHHPDAPVSFGSLAAYRQWRPPTKGAYTVGLFFPRAYWIDGSLEVFDALIRKLGNLMVPSPPNRRHFKRKTDFFIMIIRKDTLLHIAAIASLESSNAIFPSIRPMRKKMRDDAINNYMMML